LILLVLLLPALSKEKCDCDDLPRIREYLAEKEGELAAWKEILDLASGDVFLTENGAFRIYKDKLRERFPTKDFTPVGEERPGEPIKVSEEHKKRECPIVWQSTEVHERSHKLFDDAMYGDPIGNDEWLLRFVTFRAGKDYALREVLGHEAQVDFLKAQLYELEQKCTKAWKCKCTNTSFETLAECAKACPRPSLACIAPTCLEIDRKTGKWTGRAY